MQVDPPETGELEYFYDFEDIFANPEQRSLLRSPYEASINVGSGIEEVLNELNNPNEDYTDKILRLARGNT